MSQDTIVKELSRTLGVVRFIKSNMVEAQSGMRYIIKTARQINESAFVLRYKAI